jgi:hypothetical protein
MRGISEIHARHISDAEKPARRIGVSGSPRRITTLGPDCRVWARICGEIKIVRENHVFVLPGESADLCIRRGRSIV